MPTPIALTPYGGAHGSPLWDAPAGRDHVAIEFKQSIAETDGLRTGAYSKTPTFTLWTTRA